MLRVDTETGERVRSIILGLALALTACASSRAGTAHDAIDVIYVPGAMEYSIEDGGRARVIGADDRRVFEFDASHEDFQRIAELLTPLQAEGLACSAPPDNAAPGHIVWRRGDEEVRRVEMHTLCYSDGQRPLERNGNQAWRAMDEMGRARYVAPAIPDPTTISLQNLYWGNLRSAWTIPRGGEGRFVEGERVVTFPVSAETFDRVREIFRPYEGRYFECNRVITDGPYGFIIWSSREGEEDQRTQWDAGCVTGDAGDLFTRIDTAMEILVPMRDAAALEPGRTPR
jgi:hypothetical protein